MAHSGKQSPAVVQTYQELPHTVKIIQKCTLHYDAEMFVQLLICFIIDCRCLVAKEAKIKKTSQFSELGQFYTEILLIFLPQGLFFDDVMVVKDRFVFARVCLLLRKSGK